MSVGTSLWERISYRGPFYFGWDLQGPALGLYLASTESFSKFFYQVWYTTRHFEFWPTSNSLIYTIIPGYLGRLLPWEYWGASLTFLITIASFVFAMRAADLSFRACGVILLCWGATPELLSFSLTGYASFSSMLPHMMALWLVLNHKLNTKPVLVFLLGVFICEISWNVYETGRTIFIVFMLAAFSLRTTPRAIKATWLIVGVYQLINALYFRSAATFFVRDLTEKGPADLFNALKLLFDTVYLRQTISLPILSALGILCLFTLKKNKFFMSILLGFQLSLLVLVALKGELELHSRRLAVFDIYCIVIILMKWHELQDFSKTLRRAIVTILIFGNLWQIYLMNKHFQTPVATNPHPLPFTHSPFDIITRGDLIEWELSLRARVLRGETLLLLYNFSSPPEGRGDMAALLERLYVSLGHELFVEKVIVFGSTNCRFACLPIKPLQELPLYLNTLDLSKERLKTHPVFVHNNEGQQSEETNAMLTMIKSKLALGAPESVIHAGVAWPVIGFLQSE